MDQRLKLHELLKDIMETDQVYFQPPPSVIMKYPCIVYRRDWEMHNHADDELYKFRKRYQVTLIDRNPDSKFHMRISELPLCSYERFYTADNLNHDVFKLFY